MRREYEVKWYEFNLTEPKSRKFFYGVRSNPIQVMD